MMVKNRFARWMVWSLLTMTLGVGVGNAVLAQESSQLIRNRPLVRDVQTALLAKGHDPGPVDGVMGPMTRSALRSFQQANSLPADGLMTDETLTRLGVEIPSKEGDDKRDRGFLSGAASKVSSAAKTVAGATATGAKAAAGATATGAVAGAKGAAKGGEAVAEGATVAASATGSAVSTGAKASAEAGATGGKAVVSAGKTAGSAVASAAGGTKRFLFGASDEEEELGRRVHDALDADRSVNASNVEVQVKGSNVTLKFTGGTSAEWNRAVVVAKRVKGVDRVFVRTP